MAGQWQQREVYDGTYTLDDLFDWHEMKATMDENERRIHEWQEANKERS